MTYVDGFVMVVPRARLAEYKVMAETASRVWKEHGALAYRECVGEDLDTQFGRSFSELAGTSEDEVVVFSYIEYKDRQHRDEVNARVMADERIKDSCKDGDMPFDVQRMSYGGFESFVDA